MRTETTAGKGGQLQRAVEQLRTLITEGEFPPGTQLSETRLATTLRVSRHTLRETFRLLSHEGLLEQQFHKGTFVPIPGPDDLVDLYMVRLMVEPHVVRSLTEQHQHRLGPLRRAVEAGEEAETQGEWPAVITANTRFHQALVALSGSPRLTRVATQTLVEMRLLFTLVEDPKPLYVPYIAENRRVYEGLRTGDFATTATLLEDYLHQSESALQAALGW